MNQNNNLPSERAHRHQNTIMSFYNKIHENLSRKTSAELQSIMDARDESEWSDEAFVVAERILAERVNGNATEPAPMDGRGPTAWQRQVDRQPRIDIDDTAQATTTVNLLLAFAPAAMLLAFIALGSSGIVHDIHNTIILFLIWMACMVSATCCFVASSRLFRRGTAAPIMGGILLVILNGFIAFFFGCCAVTAGLGL